MADEAALEFVARLRDEASTAARGVKRTMDSLGGPTRPIESAFNVDTSKLAGAVGEAKSTAAALPGPIEDAGDEAGSGFVSGLLDSLGTAKGKAVAIVTGVAAAATAAMAGGKEILDIDAGVDKLAASLGATPAKAKVYGNAAAKVYAGAWGGSMEEVQQAVGATVSSIKGLGSGREIQGATIKALDFATAFDVDVTRAVSSVGVLISSGLAKNAKQGFDLITAASQHVPAALREDVLDASDEYAQFFNSLGFTGPQAFGVLAKGAAKGMYGIDKAGDAVKEFTIRSTDMSTSTKSAYKAIGVDAQTMSNRILAGGSSARKATGQIIKGILGIKDPTDRANTAIKLFGTPIEDLGVRDVPKFLRSLQATGGQLGKVAGASTRMGKTLNDNAKTNLTSFARQFKVALTNVVGGALLPFVSKVASVLAVGLGPAFKGITAAARPVVAFFQQNKTAATVLTAAIAALTAVVAAHAIVLKVQAAGGLLAYLKATKLVAAATRVWAAVQWAFNAAMSANPIGIAVVAIAALVAAVIYAWRNSEKFRAVVLKVWGAIKSGISNAVKYVVDFVKSHWQLLLAIIAGPLGLIVGLVIKNWAKIKAAVGTAIKAVVSVVKAGWNVAKSVVSSVLNAIKAVVVKVWSAIKTAVSTYVKAYVTVVRTAFNAAKSVISSVLNAAKSVVSNVWSAIRSVIGNAISAVLTAVRKVSAVTGIIRGAFDAAKTAVGNAVSGIASVAGTIKDKVLNALSGAASWLTSTGHDVVSGLISGIQGMANSVVTALVNLLPAPLQKFAHALGISSPSKVFKYFGAMMVEGLVRGIKASRKDAVGAVGDLVKKITDAVETQRDRLEASYGKKITRRERRNLNAWITRRRKAIAAVHKLDAKVYALADKRDKAEADSAKASARVNELLAARADLLKSVRDAMLGYADATTIGTENEAPLTAGFIVKGLQDRLDVLRDYQSNLAKLRDRGLGDATIRQILAAGVEAGGATAAALVNATAAQIKQVNELQTAVGDTADRTANVAAADLYDAGIKAAEGLVAGLLRRTRSIDQAADELAKRLRKAVRKALGIKSPSSVMRDEVGAMIPAGLALGIDAHAWRAERSAVELARRVAAAARPDVTNLAALAGREASAGLVRITRAPAPTMTLRHEIVSPDGSVDRLTAREIADVIARDPRSAARIESALRAPRARGARNTLTASR